MQGPPSTALRLTLDVAVSVAALALSPLLLLAGGPLQHLYYRYVVFGPDCPGILDKERGWMSVHYFVVHNPVVNALCWPTEQVFEWVRLSMLRRKRS